MPVVQFPYGKEFLSLDIPESRFAGIMEPYARVQARRHPGRARARRHGQPHRHPRPWPSWPRARRRSSSSAPTTPAPVPSKVIIPPCSKRFARAIPTPTSPSSSPPAAIARPPKEELVSKFGEEIVANEKIVVHDCDDVENLTYIGKLPSGGDLIVNKLAAEADLLVAEGFIEPHFFAGFSGGRKSVQ